MDKTCNHRRATTVYQGRRFDFKGDKMRGCFQHWVLIVLIVFLAGCAVHRPQAVGPSVDPPQTYAGVPADQSAPPLPARWWEAFDDPQLNQLMERVFAANLDLAEAVARYAQARAISRQSTADRLPFIDLEGSAGRSRQLATPKDVTGNSASFSAVAGFEVDVWNKLKSRALARDLEMEASREDLQALYLSLSAEAADLYFFIVEQRAQLALIDRTVATRQVNLELVERRYREGMVSALDLYQSRQNLANARARRPDVEAGLATAAHALAVLSGAYPDRKIGGSLEALPDLPEAFPAGLPSELLLDRPDIRAELLRLKADDQEIGVAVADRFPSINLIADYGLADQDFGTSLSGVVWNMAGNLALPVLDWGKRKAEVDRTRAVFEEQLARSQQTVLTAFREVEDVLVENHTSMDAIRRIQVETAAAENSLRLSVDRYRDGLSDYLPVLTAQTTLFDSQTRLLTARRELVAARISLARALGGSWTAAETDRRIEAYDGRVPS